MRRRAIVALALLFAVLTPGANGDAAEDPRPLGEVLEEAGIVMEAVADFTVDRNLVSQGPEHVIRAVAAHKGSRTLKLEVIANAGSDFANDYVADRQSMILSLYRPLPSPYPGMVTTTIECPEEFAPTVTSVRIQEEQHPVYLLDATSRFTFGACVSDLVAYRAAILFAYQATERLLVRLDLFVPKGDATDGEIEALLGTFAFARGRSAAQEGVPEAAPWNDLKDCNVIVIAFDPLGANHVGAYGYPRSTTPNLDAFARRAYLFENAISPSSWTLPVFMSWFTSLYPSQHGVTNTYSGQTPDGEPILSHLAVLSPFVVTLAQTFRANGYATAAFTGGAGVAGRFGYDIGFDTYVDQTDFAGFDRTVPLALDWLDRRRDQKFFLFLHGYDVHGRFRPPAPGRDRFVDPDYGGTYRGTAEEYWELRNRSLAGAPLEIGPEDVAFWRAWYDERIREADDRIGRLLRRIEETDLAGKTIVLISSASGNEFHEHGRFDHGFSLYDELIRVPLILKIPGLKGGRVEHQVSTLDIMPTLVDLLGLTDEGGLRTQMEGRSLVGVLQGRGGSLDAFSETDYLNRVFKRSIRTASGWKFIYSMDTGERELYDLGKDPGELDNVIHREGRIAYELEQKLFNWMASMREAKTRWKRPETGTPVDRIPDDAVLP